MSAGYTRQSAAEITASLPIKSSSVNAEYNQIQSAFDNTTGHDHSGSTTGVGAKIILTSAVTGVLPLANGGTNVAGTTGTGVVNSLLANGSARLAALNGVDVTGSVTISTTLTVTGTITASGALTVGTTLGVTGAATLSSTLGVTGTSTLGVVNSGNHAVTGTFSVSSTSTLTGNTTVGGTLGVTGILTPTGGIKGTTTNNDATALNVGEYLSATSGTVVLASGTAATPTSLSLTAGDWNVWGLMNCYSALSDASLIKIIADLSTTSGGGGIDLSTASILDFSGSGNTLQQYITPLLKRRFSLSGTTTVYLNCLCGFSSLASCTANIYARRVR